MIQSRKNAETLNRVEVRDKQTKHTFRLSLILLTQIVCLVWTDYLDSTEYY